MHSEYPGHIVTCIYILCIVVCLFSEGESMRQLVNYSEELLENTEHIQMYTRIIILIAL